MTLLAEVRWACPVTPQRAVVLDDAGSWVQLDGWVSNQRELLDIGPTRGLSPAHPCESLVFEAFRLWGSGIADRVCGELSLTLWHAERRTLFAMTDPLGSRPVFYATSPDAIAVSNSTGALCELPWIGAEPDDRSIVAFLADLDPGPDRTLRRGVRRLPGGHWMLVRPNRLEVRRYFGPTFTPPPHVRTVEDFVEEFRSRFRLAVEGRVDAARGTAILMSGGFDSTAVAAAVAGMPAPRENPSRPAIILAGGFPGFACDETSRIRSVVEHLGLQSRLLEPPVRALEPTDWEHDVLRHDGPHVALQRPIFEAYLGAARGENLGVVLTGLAGDELATDYAYEVDALRGAGVLGIPGIVREIAALEREPLLTTTRRALRQRLPPAISRAYAWLRRGIESGQSGADFVHPRLRPMIDEVRATAHSPDPLFDSHTTQIRWDLVNATRVQSARAWWTREFADAELDLRSPFQDRRLFELSLSVPQALQPRSLATGLYKPIIVLGTGHLLPSAITATYWKVVFDDYEQAVFRSSLPAIIDYLGSPAHWKCRGFIDVGAVANLLALPLSDLSTRSPSGMFKQKQCIKLLGLEAWLRALQPAANPAVRRNVGHT